MTEHQRIKTSKFLSLVLRHYPQNIGLKLDPQGWARTDELLRKAGQHGVEISLAELTELVQKCDKQRFSLTTDKSRIRANQGHTIDVDLNLEKLEPPELLFHGTAVQNIESILRNGIHRASRHHVHLSSDTQTALQVGKRYGKPAILSIRSRDMHRQGYPFYRSVNGVWLTDEVPPFFIDLSGTNPHNLSNFETKL